MMVHYDVLEFLVKNATSSITGKINKLLVNRQTSYNTVNYIYVCPKADG